MNVLVTGANGFLGRRVVAALALRGDGVRAHGRTTPVSSLPGVEHRVGDIRDGSSLAALVAGVDAVCHFAAFIPPNHADSSFAARCFEVNALASLRLAEALLTGPPRRLLLASAGNAYATRLPSDLPATEEEAPYPATRATFYLASKVTAELYVDHLARTRGLSFTSLRISTPYGPGMPVGSVVAQFMALAEEGKDLPVRHGGVPAADFVWVDDIVSLVLAALDSTETGIFNAGSGEHTSLGSLARAVQEAYADRPVGLRMEQATGDPRPSFPPLDVTKARRTFGYSPRTLAAGLRILRETRGRR